MTATERCSDRTAATARPTTPAPMMATSTSACERAAHIGNSGYHAALPVPMPGPRPGLGLRGVRWVTLAQPERCHQGWPRPDRIADHLVACRSGHCAGDR